MQAARTNVRIVCTCARSLRRETRGTLHARPEFGRVRRGRPASCASSVPLASSSHACSSATVYAPASYAPGRCFPAYPVGQPDCVPAHVLWMGALYRAKEKPAGSTRSFRTTVLLTGFQTPSLTGRQHGPQLRLRYGPHRGRAALDPGRGGRQRCGPGRHCMQLCMINAGVHARCSADAVGQAKVDSYR